MMNSQAPLSDAEFDELEAFLSHFEEAMTVNSMDGFLHAIAIGPTNIHPQLWLPYLLGDQEVMPEAGKRLASIEHFVNLVMRHFNSIITNIEAGEMRPLWSTIVYRGRTYDEARAWSYGFIEGVKLSGKDWKPLLTTPQGESWIASILRLSDSLTQEIEGNEVDKDELAKTPARRHKLALDIPQSVFEIHNYWLPHRLARFEQEMAKRSQPKIGRNDPCSCGSGRKFKKCCGAAANDLH